MATPFSDWYNSQSFSDEPEQPIVVEEPEPIEFGKYSQNDLELMEPHHDTTDLTFNMPLNDKQEFEGGGTYFVRQKYLHYGTVGNLTVHPSQITHKHGAKPVFKGARYVLISLCSNEDKARNNSIKENNNENDF